MFFFFSCRIDDILADSDSELENDIMMDGEADQRPKVKAKRSKEQRYIREDADTIVDLADINAMSKITCKLTMRISQFSIVIEKSNFHFCLVCSVEADQRRWREVRREEKAERCESRLQNSR